jgi:hypothetical protein
LGFVVAALIAIFLNRGDLVGAAKERWVAAVSLAGTALMLVAAWALLRFWEGFDRHAHAYAAVGMFLMLIGAVAAVTRDTRARSVCWAVQTVEKWNEEVVPSTSQHGRRRGPR